jgi:hypothetical protein
VAIDPAAVYASGIRTPGLLPQRADRGRSLPPGQARQRRADHGAPPRHLGTARPSGPQARSGVGQPASAAAGAERLSQSSFARMWNTIIDEDPSAQILSAWIAKEELRTPAIHRAHRRRPPPHPPSPAPIPDLVHRLPDPRTTHPSPPPSTPSGPKSTPTSTPASPTPAPRATTASSNSGQQPRLHACPVKIEDDI